MTTEAIEAAVTTPPLKRSRASAGGPAQVALDRTTLVAAYGAHRGAAYTLAYRILGDGPAAEDAVQDAFLKLWTGSAQFDPSRGSMRGLLLTIARHTSIDVIRKRANRQRTENAYCTDATYVTDGPEHATERADEARHVRDALRGLPGEQRHTIEMAYFSGLTRREIAASGSVPIGTVKSRMRLGMRKLAVTLGDRAMRPALDGQTNRHPKAVRDNGLREVAIDRQPPEMKPSP
jgi:RNA polymerase sigma-70 factor (ECF subfamily)